MRCATARAKSGGDIVEIGHGAHVDPSLRHGDDDVGVAEAQRRQKLHFASASAIVLAHEIFAGHAEMHIAAGELRDDFGGREKGDFDAGDSRSAPR